ncbi:dsrE/DsrF-like family protein [Burkholderia gladioli]|uniref:DsrE/DsrF-like family protein n=1 Tax=Burkholderia gladioli TaxID=28095 RepID=A0AAW3EPC6_BURGA|nr:DsrE family protein [Burkholderia gladioli]KGC09542.1 dsrE/DsrF-like family protein [Burkholderia gladioli]
MKIIHAVAVAVLAASLGSAALAQQSDQAPGFWTTPAISGYGPIHDLPDAAFRPDPKHSYRIVFALTQGTPSPDKVNPALDHVARTVNLYAAAGVPLSHLKFVAVAYGAATPSMLDDAHYREAYGMANPNLPLIALLKRAGVTVAVCGQAVAEHHYAYGWIATDVTLALSGLTTVTTLETEGYALMPL